MLTNEDRYITYVKTKKSTYLPKHTNFTVTYLGSDQSVYSFYSQIVSKVNRKIPALAIRIPENDKIKRIQRRDYVRIGIAVDVCVHSTDQSFAPFISVTADISGGGLSIILPKKITLAENQKLDIWFVLPMQSGKYEYIYAQSEVIRVLLSNNQVQTASVKFTSITTQRQQHVIRFSFEKQRGARKQELL